MANNILYRFRSTKQLLYKYEELEKQQIFFASPEKLNDPMEQIRDLIWEGDRIAWFNLFKHYLMCLQWTSELESKSGDRVTMTPNCIPTNKLPDNFSIDAWRRRYRTNTEKIFELAKLNELVDHLVDIGARVHKAELNYLLRSIHMTAYYSIKEFQERLCLAHDLPNAFPVVSKLRNRINWPEYFDTVRSGADAAKRDHELALVANSFAFSDIMKFGRSEANKGKRSQQNRRFMMVDFVDAYVDGIIELTQPTWYTACFTTDPTDAAQWAHYGDNHKGVCLVFDIGVVDELQLEFEQMVNNAGADEISKRYASLQFDDVEYREYVGYSRFFQTLGHLRSKELKDMWFVDENGALSTCAPTFGSKQDENKWAIGYMRQFVRSLFVKTRDWANEKEARVIISARDPEIPMETFRLSTYSFNDLKGIIFGMNTPIKKMLPIREIIEKKCDDIGRTNFVYGRAYHCPPHGRIEIGEVDVNGKVVANHGTRLW